MKALCNTLFFVFVSIFANAQTGGVGINTDSITATLDVNGTMRIRKLPDTTSHAKYFITANDSGKLFRFPYDSITQNNSSSSSPIMATFVSGDTITTGDLVAVGDGVSGVFTNSAYSNTLSTTSITSTAWLSQTLITGPNSNGIKTVILNFNITATTGGINFICSIRNTSSGSPVGLDINNQTSSVLGPTGNGNYYSYGRFTFDPPIPVLPNTKYAIIIRTQTNGSNLVQRTTTNVYSGGEIFTSNNGGATWSIQSNFDSWFNTYETNSISGKIYRSSQSVFGGDCIGWNITNPCMWASSACPPDNVFYGKRDLLDNPIGIAQNNALPGQNVTVQLSGTATISSTLPPGRPLFMGPTPGSLSTTPLNSSRQVGLSLGGNKILLRISNQ
jgi:hypothetical protein